MKRSYVLINNKLEVLAFLDMLNDYNGNGKYSQNVIDAYNTLKTTGTVSMWEGSARQHIHFMMGLMGLDVCTPDTTYRFDRKTRKWSKVETKDRLKEFVLDNNKLVGLSGKFYKFEQVSEYVAGDKKYKITDVTEFHKCPVQDYMQKKAKRKRVTTPNVVTLIRRAIKNSDKSQNKSKE